MLQARAPRMLSEWPVGRIRNRLIPRMEKKSDGNLKGEQLAQSKEVEKAVIVGS